MSARERRVVVAVCLITGVTFVVSAGLTLLLTPMLATLGLTRADAGTALELPAVASLLIVFLVGRWGDRTGHRPVIVAGSVAFVVGSLLVAAASGMAMVSAGLLLVGGAATAIQIVAVGLLQNTFPAGPARISAFTSFGMVYPAVFLVAPVATGWAVDVAPWRVVPVAWAVLGLAIPVLALRFLERPGARAPFGEPWSAALAGLSLAAVVHALDVADDVGWTEPGVAVSLLVAAVSLLVSVAVSRRSRAPSMSWGVLRRPGIPALLVVYCLVSLASTLTYVTLGFERLYGLSALVAALCLVPAQFAAVVGAKPLASWLMRRGSTASAGVVALAGLAGSLLALVALTASSPVAVLIVIAAAFSMFAFAAITIVTTMLMGGAREGESGLVSSYRLASSSLAGALAVSLLGAAFTRAVVTASTLPPDQPPDAGAFAAGLRVNGLVGAAAAGLALLAFVRAVRRTSATV